MIVIGIDPGAKGACAVIGADVRAYDAADMLRILQRHRRNPCSVFVEKQQAFSGQGVTSTFQTGLGYGKILGWLEALGYIDVTEVHPKTWQAKMLKGVEGDQKKKEKSMTKAAELFPDVQLFGPRGGKKDGRADALLIAEFGKRS